MKSISFARTPDVCPLMILPVANVPDDTFITALGGVATGSINAQLAANTTGIVSDIGNTPMEMATAPTTGKKVLVVATLEVISVKNIIKTWFCNYKGRGKIKFLAWGNKNSAMNEIKKWKLIK